MNGRVGRPLPSDEPRQMRWEGRFPHRRSHPYVAVRRAAEPGALPRLLRADESPDRRRDPPGWGADALLRPVDRARVEREPAGDLGL